MHYITVEIHIWVQNVMIGEIMPRLRVNYTSVSIQYMGQEIKLICDILVMY